MEGRPKDALDFHLAFYRITPAFGDVRELNLNCKQHRPLDAGLPSQQPYLVSVLPLRSERVHRTRSILLEATTG